MEDTAAKLYLRPIGRSESEDAVEPLLLEAPGPYTIGRSSDADWPIADQTVSRKHAVLTLRDQRWFLSDLTSRHGTSINGKKLGNQESLPIEAGDIIGFGGWTCRCQSGGRRYGMTTPFEDIGHENASISAIDATRLSGVAQRGLEALLSLSKALESASSEQAVAGAVADAVENATGCHRVVVTRPLSETEFETLAATTEEPPALSHSLIDAATRQGLVELHVAGQEQDQAHSIMQLNIRSAICAPIIAGKVPVAFIVLDTRNAEGVLPSDATAFCQSVAQLAGLAFERVLAAKLAARHAQLEQDLGAARHAQELLLPPRTGTHGGVGYAFESYAGRVVAGDLFDIFSVDAARVAFFLGDVSGKGIGAAVLMAAAQSQLRTQLLSGKELSDAIAAVSADLCRRTDPSKFVTLIAGIINSETESIEIVDAGHGLCALVTPGQPPARLAAPNGFPLGIVEEAGYETYRAPFAQGSHAVLFSDGAIEQPNAAGDELGYDAVLESIARGDTPESISAALVDTVRSHAGGEFADDLTVAAIRLRSSP